jgi:acyl carrier protein
MTDLENIERFLLSEIAADFGKQSLDPDEDLLEQRIIDSLGILKLVTFLEKAHGIQVADEDVVPDNFQSLNTIVKFVEMKMRKEEAAHPDSSRHVIEILPMDTPAIAVQKEIIL